MINAQQTGDNAKKPLVNVHQGHQSDKHAKKVVEIGNLFVEELQHKWAPVYEEIERGYNYLGGRQYTSKQKKFYNSFRRPTDVFNLIFPLFNSLMGDFITNDPTMRIFPRPGGTPEIADTLHDLLEHYHLECDYKQQVVRTAIAGCVKQGYLHTRWSDEIDIDGGLVTTNVDEFEVLFDSRAEDPILRDAQHVMRFRWLTSEQIMATWPNHKKALQTFLRDVNDNAFYETVGDSLVDMITHPQISDEREGRYRIVEFHEIRNEETEVIHNPDSGDSEALTLTGKKRELFLRAHPEYKVVTVKNRPVKRVYECLPGAGLMLDEKSAQVQDGLHDIQPFFAYSYGKRLVDHFGVFRNAQGPQNNFNQWRNTSQHIINKSANLGFKFKPEALHNPTDVENYGNEAGLNIKVKEGYNIGDVIQEGEPPKYPFATDKMAEESAALLQRITGISSDWQGFEQHASGNASLFAQKVHQTRKAFEMIYFNMRRTKRVMAAKGIRLIQLNIDMPRYFLITSPKTFEQKELFVNLQMGNEIQNNLGLGTYQVLADSTDRNPTARSLRFMQKTELVQLLIQTFGPGAVDPKWWFEEADLGDLKQVIEGILMSQQGAAIAGQEQEAMAGMQAMLGLAQQQQQLNHAEAERGTRTLADTNQSIPQ